MIWGAAMAGAILIAFTANAAAADAGGAKAPVASTPATSTPCAAPPHAPAMPQGATASEEDMKEGHDALQKYVNLLQIYETCMTDLLKNAPADTKPELKQQIQANADAANQAAHSIADVYSIQLRAYKARQDGG
jgi:hypothetical protein